MRFRNVLCCGSLAFMIGALFLPPLTASVDQQMESKDFELPTPSALKTCQSYFVARFQKLKVAVPWLNALDLWATRAHDKMLLLGENDAEGDLILTLGALKKSVMKGVDPSPAQVIQLLQIYERGLPGLDVQSSAIQEEGEILERVLRPLLHVSYFSQAVPANGWKNPTNWMTRRFDHNTAFGHTLYDVKKNALALDMGAVGLLLESYVQGYFGIPIQEPKVWEEFLDLVHVFSPFMRVVPYYRLVPQLDLQPCVNEVSCPQMDALLRRSPLCYVLSFYQHLKEGVYTFNIASRTSQGAPCFLERNLCLQKNRAPVYTLGALHEDVPKILFDGGRLKTNVYDKMTDPSVLKGKVTLGQLKQDVLTHGDGPYSLKATELLGLALAHGKFGVPSQHPRIRTEATLWLFLKALEEVLGGGVGRGHSMLYGRALAENWFGEVASKNCFIEAIALLDCWTFTSDEELRKKAASLLNLPLFMRALKSAIMDGKKEHVALAQQLEHFVTVSNHQKK